MIKPTSCCNPTECCAMDIIDIIVLLIYANDCRTLPYLLLHPYKVLCALQHSDGRRALFFKLFLEKTWHRAIVDGGDNIAQAISVFVLCPPSKPFDTIGEEVCNLFWNYCTQTHAYQHNLRGTLDSLEQEGEGVAKLFLVLSSLET